jgi:hypothetical protein
MTNGIQIIWRKWCRFLQNIPDATVFYCMAHDVWMWKDVICRNVSEGLRWTQMTLYQVLLRANFIIPSTVLFRRMAIVEFGSFDANLRSCEDWDLWLRLLPMEKIVGTSKCLVRYRVHGSSLSTDVEGMHAAT